MEQPLEHNDVDIAEFEHLASHTIEHDCEKCLPLLVKLNKESEQLKQKIKDLLQDRKEIFTKHEDATKQLHKTHLEATNKLIQQETSKWSLHTKNLQLQIENLNDKTQLYQTSKQLIEDQLKNISNLLEMYEVETDVDKKIDCKKQLYSMCGIVKAFDEQKERQQISDNSQKLLEYKATLRLVDECLAQCQQQLLDPCNELQLEKLKIWVVNLIENSTLSQQLKQPILDNIKPNMSHLNYTRFMELVLESLLNTTPHCYRQQPTTSNHRSVNQDHNLEQQKHFYEKKIEHLEQMCEINQRETFRASEEIQEHLKNEIARLKDSIITMEKEHMDDLRIMEERCRDFQHDVQINVAKTNAMTCQFNEEKEDFKSQVQALREQLDVINDNRKELSQELATCQSKYNTQQEINKSLHHALNTLRNESSVQYQMILDQCEIDKKAVIKDCDEQLELLKRQLESHDELKTNNDRMKEEITKLTDRINELRFRSSKSPNDTSLDFDYDSTIIRILKSTLVAYHRAEPHKKHEVYSILCGILGVSKDDIDCIHFTKNPTNQDKSFVSSIPIIGRLWSNSSNTNSELNQQSHLDDPQENSSFTSLLYSYLEKESNTPSLPKMSNSDIDSLVGVITQVAHQQPAVTTTLSSSIIATSSTQPPSTHPQLNLSSIIDDQSNPSIEP